MRRSPLAIALLALASLAPAQETLRTEFTANLSNGDSTTFSLPRFDDINNTIVAVRVRLYQRTTTTSQIEVTGGQPNEWFLARMLPVVSVVATADTGAESLRIETLATARNRKLKLFGYDGDTDYAGESGGAWTQYMTKGAPQLNVLNPEAFGILGAGTFNPIEFTIRASGDVSWELTPSVSSTITKSQDFNFTIAVEVDYFEG